MAEVQHHSPLTQVHHRLQMAISARTVRDAQSIIAGWTPGDKAAGDRMIAQLVSLTTDRHAQSVDAAAAYYAKLHSAAGGSSPAIVHPTITKSAIAPSLYVTTFGFAGNAMRRGFSPQAAKQNALITGSASVARLALAGGRELITRSVTADGGTWTRVLSGTCDWCEALAADGSDGGPQFQAHDNCMCTSEPDFGGAPARPSAAQPTPEELTAARESRLDPDELAFYKRAAERTGDFTTLDAKLAEAQHADLLAQFARDAPSDAVDALNREYFGSDESFIVNQALRAGDIPSAVTKSLQQAVRQWETPEPVTVHRGMWNMTDLPDNLTGSLWEDKAFQSTTFDRGRAVHWAQSRGDDVVMMDIVVPRGTAAAIGPAQSELLIPDGARIRILSDSSETIAGSTIRTLKCLVEAA